MDSSSNPKKTPLSAVERFRNLYNEVYHPELAAGGTDQATNTAPPSADVPAPTGEVTVGVGTVNPLLTLNRLHPEQPQNFQQEPEPGPGSSLESSHDSAPVSAPEFSSLPALAAPAADVLHSPIPEPDGVIQSQPVESIAAPGTVPSAASENLSSPVDPLASHDALGDAPVGSVLPGVESSPESIDLAPPDSPGSAVVRDVPHTANEYIVTLPMAASTRLHYLEAIRSNGSTLMSFGDHFTANATHFPSRALVAKVDGVFRRLYDLCDLPAFAESLPEMAAEEMRRHATGTNSKFSFVYELLNFIDDPAMKILIVARPGRVLEYLHAVVSTSGFSYGMLGNDDDADEEAHGPSVTLASSDQDLSHVSPYTELIILFDSTARTIDLPPKMRDSTGPVILSLVVTCSIEHIDLRLSETMDPLERRNAMNFALAASQSLIRDPERGSALEPHEIAERFARFLQGRSDDLDWEPQSIPDHLFDVYLSSQAIPTNPAAVVATRQTEEEAARSAARKRLLHEVDEGTPKRARMSEGFEPASTRTPPLMSDLLKKTLGEEALDKPTGPAVEISVERLEHMAAKIARLSDEIRDKEQIERNLAERCRSLEEQVRSHTKFVQEIQPKYMEALHDRGMFEKERDQAREEARKAEKRLETSNNENTRLKQKIADLEKTMEQAAAEASKSREASDAGAPNSWAVVKELEEAKTKIQSLEKKLTSAQRDLDYFRDAYQNASSAGSELGTENRELKERIEQLERKADDNLARVQEINAENMLREYQRLWEEEHAIIADRERDLERVREELRVFKNGRRETRGASVPRSPRMAIMSPRAPRGASVAGSRGNSPASSSVFDGPPLPSTTFFNQQPGSNRWGHLKD
ncbi:hypothetical protein VTK73DRAFT_7424 [Phialemonium thermophilum]|uniref:Uncharacterized protein n=1 Tax=Phialemonium thermophilum TaxID=223376 RepID=A0ABR3WES9_9PEZI